MKELEKTFLPSSCAHDHSYADTAFRPLRHIFLPSFCDVVKALGFTRIEGKPNDILANAMSLRDTATKSVGEDYYNGIMNAALMYRDEWRRDSNPETGNGYCDIMVRGMDGEWSGVFELKYSEKVVDFTAALDEGEKQVRTSRYSMRLKRMSCPRIHLYSIAFHGKRCKVREVFEKDQPSIQPLIDMQCLQKMMAGYPSDKSPLLQALRMLLKALDRHAMAVFFLNTNDCFVTILRIVSSFPLPEYLDDGKPCFRTNIFLHQPFQVVAVALNPPFVPIPRKTRGW